MIDFLVCCELMFQKLQGISSLGHIIVRMAVLRVYLFSLWPSDISFYICCDNFSIKIRKIYIYKNPLSLTQCTRLSKQCWFLFCACAILQRDEKNKKIKMVILMYSQFAYSKISTSQKYQIKRTHEKRNEKYLISYETIHEKSITKLSSKKYICPCRLHTQYKHNIIFYTNNQLRTNIILCTHKI